MINLRNKKNEYKVETGANMQECGGCTFCCLVLEIPDVPSKHNEWCKHCDSGVGCKIYGTHPKGCREFQCAWSQMENVGKELRPDKCGVLFEKATDSVMLAATAGRIEPIVEGQIIALNREGISVMLYDHKTKTKTLFPARGHTKEFVESEINDST
jgi:hypothetical protein